MLKDAPKVKFYELAAESLPEISMKHEIVAVPTVLLFRRGKAIDRVDGVNAAELTKKVKAHAADTFADMDLGPLEAPKEDLDSKLKRLIKAHKCMLLMKVSLMQIIVKSFPRLEIQVYFVKPRVIQMCQSAGSVSRRWQSWLS